MLINLLDYGIMLFFLNELTELTNLKNLKEG